MPSRCTKHTAHSDHWLETWDNQLLPYSEEQGQGISGTAGSRAGDREADGKALSYW
jgi:hypothetical protein